MGILGLKLVEHLHRMGSYPYSLLPLWMRNMLLHWWALSCKASINQ